MEDPYGEWEYTSPESEGKVNWILNRGLGLGKKVVITAIVISSLPVVLPPLLMISALGFAFSVPFGVVFATCACTEDVCFGEVVTEDEEKEKTEDAKKEFEMSVDCSRSD